MNKIITDKEIIDAAKLIFGADVDENKNEDETITIDIGVGTLTLNKTEYENNKRFYEEREKNIKEII